MNPSGRPSVQPLSRLQRRLVFWSFLCVFLITLPLLWFYTTGYRFSIIDNVRSIVSVGGLYVSTDATGVDFYIDDKKVTDLRLFRKATYIQNIIEGKHSLHVQGAGLQTWTKDLSVSSYIVTEAFAFTMPVEPHIRIISEFLTAQNQSVMRVPVATATPFAFATTTNAVIATTSKATSTLILNSEYKYAVSLFAPTPATTTTIARQISSRIERISGVSTTTEAAKGTTTKILRNVRLFENAGDVYAEWTGPVSDIPYYYCTPNISATSTPILYGDHIYTSLVAEQMRKTGETLSEAVLSLEGKEMCRDIIRIDDKQKTVRMFDFYPDSTHLVLMLLDDGLYVVEVDDRAWQNTQLLYPGTNLSFVVDGGRIYVKDRGYYLEVFTSLEQ